MCCILYYVYVKYLKKQPKKIEDETFYTTKQLNEYVRNKKRSYWCNY